MKNISTRIKKVMIFGGSGFVGKNLSESLHNYQIIKPSRNEVNVLDEKAVRDILRTETPDIVINALDSNAVDNYFEERLRMFHNLAKYSTYYGKMIYFGSGAEYGRTMPIKDITEEEVTRIVPIDSYGFCLQQMTIYARASDNIYNLRLFGIFGKYELWQKRFISNSICKALYGYPITIRQDKLFDYLCIDDLVKMTEWIIANEPKYHDYNAVSGKSILLSKIAELINEVGETRVPILIANEGVGKSYTASNTRIADEMGSFEAEEIKVSISQLFDFYRRNLEIIDKEKLLYNES